MSGKEIERMEWFLAEPKIQELVQLLAGYLAACRSRQVGHRHGLRLLREGDTGTDPDEAEFTRRLDTLLARRAVRCSLQAVIP